MSSLARLAAQARELLERLRAVAGETARQRRARIDRITAEATARRQSAVAQAGGGGGGVRVPPVIGRPDDDDDEEPIEWLGRGSQYDEQEWALVEQNAVRVVSSSNVYSYYFQPEPGGRTGILYVTFLYWEQGMKSGERSGPGTTYAYYDFPAEKAKLFDTLAQSSAGAAVWDLCRIRGSIWAHQHRYELVQAAGAYVPRKATAYGYAKRSLFAPGSSPMQRRTMQPRESTLAPERWSSRAPAGAHRGIPNRGTPNRGLPNRGTPNRGTPNNGAPE